MEILVRHYQLAGKLSKSSDSSSYSTNSCNTELRTTSIKENPTGANRVFCYSVAAMILFNILLTRSHKVVGTLRHFQGLVRNARAKPARLFFALAKYLAVGGIVVVGHLNLDPNLTLVT